MPTSILIRRIILTLIGIVTFQTVFCQENYKSGYVIRLNGDTLHGFIDYQNWGSNPDKIFFKEKMSDKKTSYTPSVIKQFGVLDEIYVSAIVETEVSTDNTTTLDHDNVLKFKTDTAFLQTMIKGSKSLYLYVNKFKKTNFYIRQDSVFELLIHKKYFKEEGGKTVIAENKRYLGQLSLYLKDCATIQSKLKDTEYGKESVESLFLFFYNCTQSGIKFQKKTEKVSTEVGILAGLSLTSLKFSGSKDFSLLVNANFHQSVNFSTGIFLDLILPRNHGNFSICNELVFTSYKVNVRYDDTTKSADQYSNSNTTLGYSYLKMVNMLRYKYPIGNLFVFINAGFSNGFAISETNNTILEEKFYAAPTFTEVKVLNSTRKFEQGYVLGLGANCKKYSFEFRYEQGNGMSDYVNLSATTYRYHFLFGYRF